MNPRKILFTKQQINELTGVSGDTLNYWMREGVLRPTEGGTGRGSHRRFPYYEVNLAAILNEIAYLGAGLVSLKVLAQGFHDAIDWAAALDLATGLEAPRELIFIQENRAEFKKRGSVIAMADDFNHKPIASRSPLSGKPQVRLTWEETVEWMMGPGTYQTELGAHFTDRHFELAEQLDYDVVVGQWSILRRIVRIPEEKRPGTFPTYFVRSRAGQWTIAGNADEAAKVGRGFIAIDVEGLLFDIWNR